MNVHKINLKNGFKIIYVERNESDVVAISLLGKAGASFEQIPGTAHFLEHVVLDGTQKYPTKEQLESVILKSGGISNGRTSKDFVEFYVKIIKSEVKSGFEYLSQVVFHPLLRNEDVEKERKIILQEIKRAESNDSRQLFESTIALSYNSKPMKRMVLGDKDSASKIDKDILKNYWLKHYTVDNFVLCVSGNLSLESIRTMGEGYFGNIPTGGEVNLPSHAINSSANIKVLRRENVTQARFNLAYPAPLTSSPKYYTALLISFILGKGPLSRLFRSVREEKQLAYDISSWVWRGCGHSLIYIQAGVDESKINETIKTIAKELEKLSRGELSEKELLLSKKKAESDFLFYFEDSLQVSSYHTMLTYLFPESNSYEDELRNIESVTAGEIKRVAAEIFSQNPHLCILAKKTEEKEIDLSSLVDPKKNIS